VNNAFFNCLFLNKLSRELRILLSEADMADKQALGARADSFAAHNSKLAHDVAHPGIRYVPPDVWSLHVWYYIERRG
jgi:hypothetical protein